MDDSNAVSVDMETIYLGGKVIFFLFFLFAAFMFGFYDSWFRYYCCFNIHVFEMIFLNSLEK